MATDGGVRPERDASRSDPHIPKLGGAVSGATRPQRPFACGDIILLERRLPGTLEEVWNFLIRHDQLGPLISGQEAAGSAGRSDHGLLFIEPPRLLAFPWNSVIPAGESGRERAFLVTVELTPDSNAVRLRLSVAPKESLSMEVRSRRPSSVISHR